MAALAQDLPVFLTVLKMPGRSHDSEIRDYAMIRDYAIDGDGMRFREPFGSVGGILAGNHINLATLPSSFHDSFPPPGVAAEAGTGYRPSPGPSA